MPQIGQFIRTQSGYSGRLHTAFLDQEVSFARVETTESDNMPAYRIHLRDADGPEIGAGWTHTGDRAGTYVSVVIDDPTFAQPIRARLFQSSEDGRDWTLHWTRPKKRDDQE